MGFRTVVGSSSGLRQDPIPLALLFFFIGNGGSGAASVF